jgi:hypothetical protein
MGQKGAKELPQKLAYSWSLILPKKPAFVCFALHQ